MATTYPQVVLLGDSLFEHAASAQDGFSFQSALQSQCIRRLDVINRGMSGWNTKNVLDHIEHMFPPIAEHTPKIEYLMVLLGANDAELSLPSTYQSIPLDQYRGNLKAIVTHPRITAHNPKILLVTPPALDELNREKMDKSKGHDQVVRRARHTAAYAQAARDVAAEVTGVVLIDLWQAIFDRAVELTPGWIHDEDKPWLGTLEAGVNGGFGTLLTDGLHMRSEGYMLFYSLVAPYILTGADLTDRETLMYPDWRVLNTTPGRG